MVKKRKPYKKFIITFFIILILLLLLLIIKTSTFSTCDLYESDKSPLKSCGCLGFKKTLENGSVTQCIGIRKSCYIYD